MVRRCSELYFYYPPGENIFHCEGLIVARRRSCSRYHADREQVLGDDAEHVKIIALLIVIKFQLDI